MKLFSMYLPEKTKKLLLEESKKMTRELGIQCSVAAVIRKIIFDYFGNK